MRQMRHEKGELMKRSILLVGVVMLAGAVAAFCQAAAESVMIHSMSAGAGAKAGTSLGRSTSNAASRLGGRLGSATSGATSHSSGRTHATIRPAAPPMAETKAPASCAQPDPKPAQAGTNPKPDCQVKAPSQAEQDKARYKKFVTLTFDNK
jgi:hypothetical protein